MPDQRNIRFVRFLADYCATSGVSREIVTDNAKSFDNALIKQLNSLLPTEHRYSPPRHHRGNAVAEGVIELLLEKLYLLY